MNFKNGSTTGLEPTNMIKSKTGNVDKSIYSTPSLKEQIMMATDLEKERFDFLSDIAGSIKAK